MSHPTELNDTLRRLKLETAPPPWRRTVHAIGGLTEVGYMADSDLLLTVTSTGRGLFDCLSGQRVARDPTPPEEGGSIRRCKCGSWMSHGELRRLFRRATVAARHLGEGAHPFRARLSHFLREYFEE